MTDDAENRFTTRSEFEGHFLACIAQSNATLSLFDPDFAVFPLGSSEAEMELAQSLASSPRARPSAAAQAR